MNSLGSVLGHCPRRQRLPLSMTTKVPALPLTEIAVGFHQTKRASIKEACSPAPLWPVGPWFQPDLYRNHPDRRIGRESPGSRTPPPQSFF